MCQCKDPDQTTPLSRQIEGSNVQELITNMQLRQKLLSQNIIQEKTHKEEKLVAKWLKENTKHFGRMSMELVKELAQLMFVIPES